MRLRDTSSWLIPILTLLVASTAPAAAQAPLADQQIAVEQRTSPQSQDTFRSRTIPLDPGAAADQQQDAPAQQTIDRNYVLNIGTKRITEHDFVASASVESGEKQRDWDLLVGGSIHARDVKVLMHGVHGHIRLHASLQRLQQLIHPGPAPTIEK